MKRAFFILLAISAFALSGCDDESPYSGYRVNFSFNPNMHPYNQALSPGQYICVRKGSSIGQYRLTDALGNTQTVNIPEFQLQSSPFYYGLGGLIIGTPMAADNTLWAFDWACPNCEQARFRLNIDRVLGHASCSNCGVKFDLNSGGIAIDGKSRPMWHYRIYPYNDGMVVQN